VSKEKIVERRCPLNGFKPCIREECMWYIKIEKDEDCAVKLLGFYVRSIRMYGVDVITYKP